MVTITVLGIVLVSVFMAKILYDYLSIDPETIYDKRIKVCRKGDGNFYIVCRKGWFAKYKLERIYGDTHFKTRKTALFIREEEAVNFASEVYRARLTREKRRRQAKSLWTKEFVLQDKD